MTGNRLTPDQKRFYEENGYILVKGLFTREEAAEFRREGHALIDRISKLKNVDATWNSAQGQGTQIYHCHDVQFFSAIFSRMIIDPRMTGIMQDLIGPNVALHHTKMFIKPPEKGSPFPMHQDYPYFPHARNTMSAAIVHFDDAPLEKGCLRVVPGSHKLGPIEPDNPRDRSLSMKRYPIEGAHPCVAEAGDVVFFNYLTIHGSGVNTSSEARTTVLIQFRDPTDRPTQKGHESQGQNMMLAGIDPESWCLPGRANAPKPEPAMAK